jgi:hypothetical protein
MRRNHLASVLALLIVALTVAVSVEAVNGERSPLPSRVLGMIARLTGNSTAQAAGVMSPVRASGERLTVQSSGGGTHDLGQRLGTAEVSTEYVGGDGLPDLAGDARARRDCSDRARPRCHGAL